VGDNPDAVLVADTVEPFANRPRPVELANADRIVACVNACKGIPDPEETIPELVELARQVVLAYVQREGNIPHDIAAGARRALDLLEGVRNSLCYSSDQMDLEVSEDTVVASLGECVRQRFLQRQTP
jgi:hypothetical protein